MTNQRKVNIGIFLIVCISTISCLLGQPLLRNNHPVNPGTDRIAFKAGSSPGLSGLFLNYDIYVMNVNSLDLTRVTRQSGIDSTPAWSPMEDKIAYTRIDGLYIVNTDGSSQPELLWRSIGRGTIVDPAWSPNGLKIAFSEGVIYILDVKTKEAFQLTNDSIPSDEPTWSSDGSKIAFTFRPYITTPGGGPEGAVATINVDGSNFVQLTDVDGSSSPAWSPDGSHIAFHREGNIYVMDADGTNVTALTQDGKSYSPAWSPNGDRIAFVSFKNSKCGGTILDSIPFCTSELHIMETNSSDVIVVRSKKNENIADPTWAP